MNEALERLTAALADPYRVERELGAGGMATVIGAARFLIEIKTTANLQHPHILSLHDSGAVEEAVRIATEVAMSGAGRRPNTASQISPVTPMIPH